MSKHEMIRAPKDAEFRAKAAGDASVSPAATARRVAGPRNMKMMTNLKAGLPTANTKLQNGCSCICR